MTVPPWHSNTPLPGANPPPIPPKRAGLHGMWAGVFAGLLILALVGAGISAYGFAQTDKSESAKGQNKTTVEHIAPVPIKKEDAALAHSPEHKQLDGGGPEKSPRIGEAVLFTNGIAARIDSIEPATLWPNSEFDVLLGPDARIFALRYTMTNFSDRVQKAPPLGSIRIGPEPYDAVELPPEMKDVSLYQPIIHSNSAALPHGSSAMMDESGKTGSLITELKPGATINGVIVSYELRTGAAMIKVEIGIYKEVGVVRFYLNVP
jgi:hypothetical protein